MVWHHRNIFPLDYTFRFSLSSVRTHHKHTCVFGQATTLPTMCIHSLVVVRVRPAKSDMLCSCNNVLLSCRPLWVRRLLVGSTVRHLGTPCVRWSACAFCLSSVFTKVSSEEFRSSITQSTQKHLFKRFLCSCVHPLHKAHNCVI